MLCVIVKRAGGGDFALNQGALDYLLKRQANGALKDGSPVQQAIVVLADMDNQGGYKSVQQWPAEEMRDRFSGVEPQPSKFAPYWWIRAVSCDDELIGMMTYGVASQFRFRGIADMAGLVVGSTPVAIGPYADMR